MQRKARLVWLRKLQGVWQISRLKQQRSLSFIFCETPRSYRKSCVFICYFIDSMVKIVFSEAATGGVLYKKVFLKFKKFTGKHKARISFLINLQAPLTSLLILTWKSWNILYRKLMNCFFIEQLQWLLLSYNLVSERTFKKESFN